MRIFTLLSKAFTKLGLISDYVVEQGTSGIWTYRKWNSGVAECWNTEPLSFTGSSASGALMGGRYAQLNNPTWGTFPFAFTDTPGVFGHGRLGTGAGFLSVGQSATKITVVSCVGNQSSTNINNVSIYVIGTWK